MRPAAERAKRQVRLYGLQVNLRKQQPKMAEQQRGRFVPFVLAKGGDPQVLQEAPSASQIAAPSAPEQMPSAPEIAPSALAQRVTGEGEARAETGPELDARMAQQAANRNERTPYRPSEMAQRSAAHTRSLNLPASNAAKVGAYNKKKGRKPKASLPKAVWEAKKASRRKGKKK